MSSQRRESHTFDLWRGKHSLLTQVSKSEGTTPMRAGNLCHSHLPIATFAASQTLLAWYIYYSIELFEVVLLFMMKRAFEDLIGIHKRKHCIDKELVFFPLFHLTHRLKTVLVQHCWMLRLARLSFLLIWMSQIIDLYRSASIYGGTQIKQSTFT